MASMDPAASGGQPTPEPATLGERYELGAVLGCGGMALVRRATDLRLGRTVAVKTLRGDLAETPSFRTRFRREARAAAALDHPAVVSVYDAGEESLDGVMTPYIVMEYVEGRTLRELLRDGAQPPRRALEITADVLDALEHSHSCGIVHRDVKPANVMVTPTGAVKVMDFGVARAVADMSAALTQTSTVIGTAFYLSPEQARGEDVDARSDVYSTGCLLYELLTGRPPFLGDSAVAVAYQHVREDPQPPSAYEPSLPAEVDAVVLAALAKQPGARYGSAADMRSDILRVLAGERVAPPVSPSDTAPDLQPVAAGGAAAGALAATGAQPAETAETGVDGAGEPPSRHRRGKVAVAITAAAVFLVLALGGFALSGLGDGQTPAPVTPRQQDGRTGAVTGPKAPNETRQPGAPSDVAEVDRDGRQQQGQGNAGAGRHRTPETTGQDDATTEPDTEGRRPEPTTQPRPESTPTDSPEPEQTAPEQTTEPTPQETTEPDPSPSPEPSSSQEPEPSPTPTTEAAGVA